MREGRCVMVRNEKKEMTAGEIADKICEIAPEALQETWDNSGFLAGSRKHPVTKVLTCLDLDFSVLKEAEQSVLGGLLLDNSAWDRIADYLNQDDFYRFDPGQWLQKQFA